MIMKLFTIPKVTICLMVTILVASLGLAQSAWAVTGSDFNAAYIIDDSKFFNPATMGTAEIQNFLNAKVPVCDTNGTQLSGHGSYSRAEWGTINGVPPPYICLKNYSQSFGSVTADSYCAGITGGTKSAANIIYDVAQACGVNPQVLIVLLQKEQSLVTDEWPWPVQYQKATGYGCPDTGGCNPDLAGFFNQVYYAARQFQRYVKQPQLFNYAVSRTSYILYNPNTACGGTNVTIQNGATAALYNYTPYQPNQAALNNLYGTGDSCSAYGNRNFWRLYNDWFGPSTGEGYVLATSFNDNGDPRQWVIYHNIKRHVPDEETIKAWGLDQVPLTQMTGQYLGSIPSASHLTRLMRPTGTLDVYFVDGGKCFKILSPNMYAAWGINTSDIRDVSIDLGRVPVNSGLLQYAVDDPNTSDVYMVDGLNGSNQLVLRKYQGPDLLSAWEGDGTVPTPISTTYFNSMDNAIGSVIDTTKIVDGSQEYQAVAGQKLSMSSSAAQLYPGVAKSYSSATLNRLVTSAPVTHFIRAANSSTVYLVDGLSKHSVGSPDLVRAWGIGPNPAVNIVTQGSVNLLSSGAALNSFEADVGGQLYLMDGRKITVPSALDGAYRTTGNVYSPSSALMSLLPLGETATGFMKGFQNLPIYLMDAGKKRHVRTPEDLALLSNGGTITSVSDYVLNQFLNGGFVGSYVTDGTTEYLIETGTKHSISASAKSNWQISNPDILAVETLGRFPTGSALGNLFKYSDKYYRVHEGVAFITVDANIAEIWGVKDAATMNNLVADKYLSTSMMTRFAKSKLNGDSRQFVVDNGVLYHLSPEQAANLGLTGNMLKMAMNPEGITGSITLWSGIVVKDAANKAYVIDGGTKRLLADGIIRNFWTNNGSISVQQMTNGFLNLLPTTTNIERAVKGSGSNIYVGENITKRWIQSWNTYVNEYAPYASVNDSLLNVLPSGSNLP